MAALIQRGKKVVAVGKNYAKHVVEMAHTHKSGTTTPPKDPVLFLKPTTCYAAPGEPLIIPKDIGEVHHELELAVVINKTCSKLESEDDWEDYVAGYCLALDMTARDIQTAAKAKGWPWCVAKGYDTFLPYGPFVPVDDVTDHTDLTLWLDVNGERRQTAAVKDMVFKLPFLMRYISHIFTLEEGDMIITGTPEGVAAVFPDDTMTAGVEGSGAFDMTVKVQG